MQSQNSKRSDKSQHKNSRNNSLPNKMIVSCPNYFPTPNDLVDYWLPHLNGSDTKVLLVILRKTFGWHKTRDRISLSQMQKITGLSRPTVLASAKSLQNKGIIRKEVVGENGEQETYYDLIVFEEGQHSDPPPSSVKVKQKVEIKKPLTGKNPNPPPVKESYPQKTLLQKKREQQQQPPLEKKSEAIKSSKAAPAAAASFDKKVEKPKSIYPCLEKVDMPRTEKEWLTKRYSEPDVELSIAWLYDSTTELKKTPAQALKWFCGLPPESRPKTRKSKQEIVNKNKAFAQKVENKFYHTRGYLFLPLNSECSIERGAYLTALTFKYDDEDFQKKIFEALQKNGFKMRK